MICPQTNEQCRNSVTCAAIEECLHPSGGKLPPKPDLSEIERLVDSLMYHAVNDDIEQALLDQVALMAAIQKALEK